MNIFTAIRNNILDSLNELVKDGKLPATIDASRMVAEPPRDAAHGDAATNAAMVMANQAGMKPREFAELLAEKLKALPIVDSVEIAGPGFVNMRLSKTFWDGCLQEILEAGESFGSSDMGKGRKKNVEFVSANPTGPMHVGHSRGAVFGDALASLLQKAGYDVTREYYINDAGAQVDVLARSAFLRYKEALGENIGAIPEGLYPGAYLIPVGKALAEKYGKVWLDKPEAEWLSVFRAFAIEKMMDMIRDDLAALGIKFDVFSSERALVEAGKIDEVIEFLRAKGLVYEGVLEPPKGKIVEDYEPHPQTLFKATLFGDDVDRALKKSNGFQTYFASDMAYHLDKYRRGFDDMIDVWGADHGGYVKRMQAAIKALTDGKAKLDIKLCQMVNLMSNGEPVKMSKRAGTFVTLRDMVDAVGKDVMRFIMLTRKNDAQLDFDVEKVKEQSKDNPVFYVNYAYARAASVRRRAREMFPNRDLSLSALAKADFSLLNDDAEVALIRLLAEFPRQVEVAAAAHEPHRIAYYLNDVASAFHGLWNKGRENADLRFLEADKPEQSLARLALIEATAVVIASGLGIFGVTPAEEM
ncbi:MAG TPA: arginine--tRNA ligase [Alphaproteobacteria bacterium]|nr:arginine--tRNA ligase [Alphaproteobacteria bacterium]